MERVFKTPLRIRLKNNRYRERRRRDPARVIEETRYNQRYRRKNAKKLKRQNQEYQRKNSVEIRLKRAGLSVEYAPAIRKHKGKCDLCGAKGDGRWKTLNIDHCHKKKVFRGLLCSNCNRAIGYFKDNSKLMRKAAAYVEIHT